MKITEQNTTINEVSFSFKIEFKEPKIFYDATEITKGVRVYLGKEFDNDNKLTTFRIEGYYNSNDEEIKVYTGKNWDNSPDALKLWDNMDYYYFCELNGLNADEFRDEIIGAIDTDKIMEFSG